MYVQCIHNVITAVGIVCIPACALHRFKYFRRATINDWMSCGRCFFSDAWTRAYRLSSRITGLDGHLMFRDYRAVVVAVSHHVQSMPAMLQALVQHVFLYVVAVQAFGLGQKTGMRIDQPGLVDALILGPPAKSAHYARPGMFHISHLGYQVEFAAQAGRPVWRSLRPRSVGRGAPSRPERPD